MSERPELRDIRAAAQRLEGKIHRTPVLTSASLDALAGATLRFKCENFQRAGAFKIRGALNAVLSLDEAAAGRGVVTHSSGNFAAALSLAARLRSIRARVVMPEGSPVIKQEAVRAFGGEIVVCAPTLASREETAARVQEETGATFLHPYNDHVVIAGQGTCGLEICEEEPALDVLVAPVGGGGLMSGCAIAARALIPGIAIYGAEPALADDARRSLAAGRLIPRVAPTDGPDTIGDGLRTSLGDKTWPILREHLAGIIAVDEAAIAGAMRLIWERLKIVVEPSAAVSLAAVLAEPERFQGQRVGLVLSGGNVDLGRLPW